MSVICVFQFISSIHSCALYIIRLFSGRSFAPAKPYFCIRILSAFISLVEKSIRPLRNVLKYFYWVFSGPRGRTPYFSSRRLFALCTQHDRSLKNTPVRFDFLYSYGVADVFKISLTQVTRLPIIFDDAKSLSLGLLSVAPYKQECTQTSRTDKNNQVLFLFIYLFFSNPPGIKHLLASCFRS